MSTGLRAEFVELARAARSLSSTRHLIQTR